MNFRSSRQATELADQYDNLVEYKDCWRKAQQWGYWTFFTVPPVTYGALNTLAKKYPHEMLNRGSMFSTSILFGVVGSYLITRRMGKRCKEFVVRKRTEDSEMDDEDEA